jgi:hypothetical protein
MGSHALLSSLSRSCVSKTKNDNNAQVVHRHPICYRAMLAKPKLMTMCKQCAIIILFFFTLNGITKKIDNAGNPMLSS